jgi:hypothetical protein
MPEIALSGAFVCFNLTYGTEYSVNSEPDRVNNSAFRVNEDVTCPFTYGVKHNAFCQAKYFTAGLAVTGLGAIHLGKASSGGVLQFDEFSRSPSLFCAFEGITKQVV